MIAERQWLKDKLVRYGIFCDNDLLQLQNIQRVRAFVDENTDCFQRTNLLGHITGSAWIMNEAFDACLLMHHRKLGVWLQPGGHADGEWDVFKVALKEAQEETGILDFKAVSQDIFDVDIHAIPGRGLDPQHLHFDIRFLFQANSTTSLPSPNEESLALAWVPVEEALKNPLYANVQRLAEKSLKMKISSFAS